MGLISEKLKYARERSGLTGLQVKERTGIGESSLSEIENGRRDPSVSQLTKLAQIYRRTLDFFLSDVPIPKESVLWRQRPENGKEVESEFLKLCVQYHNLEVWANDITVSNLPTLKNKIDSFDKIPGFAKTIRDNLELGDRPALTLFAILEEYCAIKIFHMEFEPTGTAASTVNESFGMGVLLNSGNKRWRRNFDLAHELFHLLMWGGFPKTVTDSGSELPEQDEEQLADAFASELLMPSDSLRNILSQKIKDNRVTLENLFDVARQFDVSVEALIWRMRSLRYFTHEQARDLVEKCRGLAIIFDKRSDAKPSRWPDRYEALAMKALRRGEMSTGTFASYLDVTRQEAMRYLEQEAINEEVAITPA